MLLPTFITEHWVIGGIGASLLWYLAGAQSLSNRKPQIAIIFQIMAVLIVLVMSGWAIAQKEWLGLVLGTVVLYFEVRAIRRIAGGAPLSR